LNGPTQPSIDETSPRYDGWRVVGACFLVAIFGWGLCFYGQSVFLAELHRLHGWPTSQISTATTFFYLVSAVLVAFVSDVVHRYGPRICQFVVWRFRPLRSAASIRRGSFTRCMS